MANKLKKETPKKKTTAAAEKKTWKPEKTEQIDLKALAKDERTHKILGAASLLLAIFLGIAILSYFATWRQDQDEAFRGSSILWEDNVSVANLMGKIGALISHFFIYKAFGIASLLVCTFFFVIGINLMTSRKVFSIWRNLKYVTLGVLVLSVSLAFIFRNSEFSWGGGVGRMISSWLIGILGNIGTAAILLLMAAGYFIWQFNPAFNLPVKNKPATIPGDEVITDEDINEEEEEEEADTVTAKQPAIKPVVAEPMVVKPKPNKLKEDTEAPVVKPVIQDEKPSYEFTLIEKEEEEADPALAATLTVNDTFVEQEVVADILHSRETIVPEEETEPEAAIEEEPEPEEPQQTKPAVLVIPPSARSNKIITVGPNDGGLTLEIKTNTDEKPEEEPEIKTAETVAKLPPYESTLDLKDYKYPGLDLLETHGSEKIVQDPAELEENKNQIISTLRNYAIEIQKISATVGPTVTLYEIVPAAGVRISRIRNLEDDIALSLAALGIRIIAPIPGKGTIGIEVPNTRKTVVSMKTLLESEKFQHSAHSLPIAIGKRIDNTDFIVDLASMPHLLMAGATGQGKSVGLNAILVSLLYKKHPSQLKFVLVDPKKVELSIYKTIEHHFLAKLPNEEEAIITDTRKVINTLNALCIEMDNRYDLLKEAGCRNIKEYNSKFTARKLNPEKGHQYLPFIVLVVDEFADLIMTAGKEVEMPIARLAQLARAVGIHLIIATQRPSVNIITGTIKANFPARIAFKVSSKIDSRTILDAGGAEQLIGKGDMLISFNGEIVRLQCAFVDTPEVDKITDFIGYQEGYPQAFLLPEYVDEKEQESRDFDIGDRDSLFGDAAKLIVISQSGSTSLLQRKMKLGYNRAGRLMDQLEAAGIVGPNQGSKPREVLIKTDMELQQHLDLLG
jgi:S-DNA-T family DNA segregation ATPase FtsK/SpoIIIE